MENKHKEFKPFDMVMVRDVNPYWSCDLYSHFNSDSETHETTALRNVEDNDIIPYEGNEHLVGTTDEPEEEIELKEGEWLVVTNSNIDAPLNYNLRQYYKLDRSLGLFHTKIGKAEGTWNFAIRLFEFNPNDMEETRKHVLCVKNGKIIKFHGKD